MVTRSKAGIFKPKVYLGTAQWTGYSREPTTVSEALQHPKWKEAMEAEYSTLVNNKTWSLVPREENLNIVGNKWVFKEKYNADGSLKRFKARLVEKDFHQRPGLDFGETFSPVVKASTI